MACVPECFRKVRLVFRNFSDTERSILKHLWNLFENAVKISDKLSILKSIEKTSDNLPTILWNANEYGKKIKIEKKMQEFNKNSIWNDP